MRTVLSLKVRGLFAGEGIFFSAENQEFRENLCCQVEKLQNWLQQRTESETAEMISLTLVMSSSGGTQKKIIYSNTSSNFLSHP